MNAPNTKRRRSEEGMALLYVAIFLLVSLWFVSLAIDVGKLMAARTELQAAADAAALAGASALDPTLGVLDQPEAKARAAAAAASNHAYQNLKTPVVINPDVDVEFPGTTGRQVKVSVYRDADHSDAVMLHFAQTLGLRFMDVRANATAEIGPLVGVCEGLAPFAPEQPPYGDFAKDCDSTYFLKVGTGASLQGNFQLLDYPDCAEQDSVPSGGGGAAVRYYIINGWDCCFKIGDLITIDTEPGGKVGPTQQGLLARWLADTDQNTNICYEQYTGNQSRVFLCPIIKDFDVNGKKEVEILKFAAFFLKDKPPPPGQLGTTGIQAQFLDYVAPGVVGDVPPDSTSVYGVHLIE